MVLGPRLKVINLNILPESSRNKVKYSLKIGFMFFSIILKFQVPDLNILLGVREKRRPFSMVLGPRKWSLVHVSGKQHEKNVKIVIVSTGKCPFHKFHVFFFHFLMQLSLSLFSEDVVSIKESALLSKTSDNSLLESPTRASTSGF